MRRYAQELRMGQSGKGIGMEEAMAHMLRLNGRHRREEMEASSAQVNFSPWGDLLAKVSMASGFVNPSMSEQIHSRATCPSKVSGREATKRFQQRGKQGLVPNSRDQYGKIQCISAHCKRCKQ